MPGEARVGGGLVGPEPVMLGEIATRMSWLLTDTCYRSMMPGQAGSIHDARLDRIVEEEPHEVEGRQP